MNKVLATAFISSPVMAVLISDPTYLSLAYVIVVIGAAWKVSAILAQLKEAMKASADFRELHAHDLERIRALETIALGLTEQVKLLNERRLTK